MIFESQHMRIVCENDHIMFYDGTENGCVYMIQSRFLENFEYSSVRGEHEIEISYDDTIIITVGSQLVFIQGDKMGFSVSIELWNELLDYLKMLKRNREISQII